MANTVVHEIINDINSGHRRCFALIADEYVDVSNTKSICLRWIVDNMDACVGFIGYYEEIVINYIYIHLYAKFRKCHNFV